MTQADPAATTHSLTELPECSRLRAVTAVPAEVAGRRALRVELTDAVTLEGKSGVVYVDMPTSVIIPASYINGTIEVNILSRLNGKGPADARAFAGIAFRVTADGDHFEAVYLRPLNGQRTHPPSPRDQRGTRSRRPRPVRRHRQRILLLQPQDHAALSGSGGLLGRRMSSVHPEAHGREISRLIVAIRTA